MNLPVRRQAAHLTMAVSEYFRDQNRHVLCLMDSVTRFAMARESVCPQVSRQQQEAIPPQFLQNCPTA